MEKKYKEGMLKLDDKIKSLQQIQKIIKLLDKEYKNKLIHFSMEELHIDKLFNMNKYNESWLGGGVFIKTQKVYGHHVGQIG